MKAMSYFTFSVARHGEYSIRPKVDIPEKTESACGILSPEDSYLCQVIISYLCASIAR